MNTQARQRERDDAACDWPETHEGGGVLSSRLMSAGSRNLALSAALLLLFGALIRIVGQSSRFMGLIGPTLQNIFMLVSVILVFIPVVYSIRWAFGRPIVRRLTILGLGCEFMNILMDILDGIPSVNGYWLLNEANPFHIVAQELFAGAAISFLCGGLSYFIVSSRTSATSLARERDLLQYEVQARRKVENALQQEKDFSNAMLFNLPGILYLLDEQGLFLRWNEGAEKDTGYSSAEIAHMSAVEFFAEDEKQIALAAIQKVFEEGFNSIEATLVTKEGLRRPYLHTGTRIMLNGKPHLLGIGTDISQRIAAEGARRQHSEALHQTLDGIAIADLSGVVEFVNPAWAAMHGYTPEELEGKHIRVFHTSEQMARDVNPLLKTLMVKGGHVDEVDHVTKDGVVFPTRMSVTLVRDDHGVPQNVVAVARDLSHERKLENELRHAQKMEAIGTFAGGTAHNLRNNLAAILGWIEIAEENIADAAMVRKSLHHAAQAGMQATEHIKQILTFSRTVERRREPLNIATAVDSGLKLLRSTLPSTVELRQQIDPACGLVLGDVDGIHQIIINLATNAFDAMHETGGTLTVSLEPMEMSLHQSLLDSRIKPGQYACLRVHDSGCGMTQKVLDRIFEPFFTTKEVGAGTGLGLSAVHGIVEGLGGSIQVSSVPNEGTTFSVLLPICTRSEGVESKSYVLVNFDAAGVSNSVMLVDDDEQFLLMTKTGLELLGYCVAGFSTSIQALDAFRVRPEAFDVILLDEIMPGMKGMEMAARIHEIRADVPIVMISGISERINPWTAQEVGVSEIRVKPVTPRDLTEAIQRVVSTQRAI